MEYEPVKYLTTPSAHAHVILRECYRLRYNELVDAQLEASIYQFMQLFPNHDPECLADSYIRWRCLYEKKTTSPERVDRIVAKIWNDFEEKHRLIAQMSQLDPMRRLL